MTIMTFREVYYFNIISRQITINIIPQSTYYEENYKAVKEIIKLLWHLIGFINCSTK